MKDQDPEWEAELVRTGRTERNPHRPRPTAPAKWTKKEIATLKGHLDTFWLLKRPLSGMLSESGEAAEAVRAFLAIPRQRTHVVLAGIRYARERSSARYRETCEVIGHALVQGRSDDAAERVQDAKEHEKGARVSEAMLEKVLDHWYPEEVQTYDPTKR